MSRLLKSMGEIESFGAKIRHLRLQTGMPLRKLAALIDLDQSTLSKIERNERSPNLKIVDRICSVFSDHKNDILISFYSDLICKQIYEARDISGRILQVSKIKLKNISKKSQVNE